MSLVGQTVREYQLLKYLGGGSEGDVYLGEHIHSKELAAVKILPPFGKGPTLQEFMEEANFFLNSQHPNIAKVLAIGVLNDRPYIVSYYYPNGDLKKRMLQGSIPFNDIIKYGCQIASALSHMHKYHYVHRDVKPGNILIDTNGDAVLTDFGIITQSYTYLPNALPQSLTGTLAYMAPEQFAGKAASASDQYSLAVVLYMLHFEVLPLDAKSTDPLAWYQLHRDKEVKILDDQGNTWLKDKGLTAFYQVLEKALSKDPAARYANMQEFANALQKAKEYHDMFPFIAVEILLIQVESSQLLDGTADGRKVYMHGFNDAGFSNGHQRWRIIYQPDGWVNIQHVQSALLFDGSPDSGCYLEPNNGGDYQLWKIERSNRAPYFKLMQKATGLYLDADTRGVYLNQKHDNSFQNWVVGYLPL